MNSKELILKEIVDMTPDEADEVLAHLLTVKRRRKTGVSGPRAGRMTRVTREPAASILHRFGETGGGKR